MKPVHLLCLASAALALPAFAQEEAPAMEDLMALAFPKWSDDSEGRVQQIPATSVTLAWRKDAPPLRTRRGAQRSVEVEPVRVMQLSPNRFMLLALMRPVSKDGTPETGPATPVGLAAYTYQTSATGWKLARRQEPFDLQGFEGRAELAEVDLSEKSKGIAVEYGSCWQGQCGTLFAIYEIGKDGVQARPLLQQKLSGGNVYARPDCAQRLRNTVPGQAPMGGDDPVPEGSCHSIQGHWRIEPSRQAPGALITDFKGGISVEGSSSARPVERRMRFEYRGGRYEPVSGNNPVPDN